VSVATKNQAGRQVLNVPNQLTALRLVLSVVLFVLIPLQFYGAAMALFFVAAATDWLDGYWARKYGQVTTLGRILDPFVDKIIICGTFIFLAAIPTSGIAAWMAVVVLRGLLNSPQRYRNGIRDRDLDEASEAHAGAQAQSAAVLRAAVLRAVVTGRP
jgi:CDP-diacylglycerol--glycerol-3-phosphate 3-phosphatidyltransferase